MVKQFKNQPKEVYFKPEHFGAYNFFMWLTGIFAGISFVKSYWFLIGVVGCFLLASNFYAKSQNYFNQFKKDDEEYIDVESSNVYK